MHVWDKSLSVPDSDESTWIGRQRMSVRVTRYPEQRKDWITLRLGGHTGDCGWSCVQQDSVEGIKPVVGVVTKGSERRVQTWINTWTWSLQCSETCWSYQHISLCCIQFKAQFKTVNIRLVGIFYAFLPMLITICICHCRVLLSSKHLYCKTQKAGFWFLSTNAK